MQIIKKNQQIKIGIRKLEFNWWNWNNLNLSGFEDPMTFAIIVHVIPPSKPHHKSPCNIFDSPEVHRKEENDCDKTSYKTIWKPAAKHVYNYCRNSECEMEHGNVGVPKIIYYKLNLSSITTQKFLKFAYTWVYSVPPRPPLQMRLYRHPLVMAPENHNIWIIKFNNITMRW